MYNAKMIEKQYIYTTWKLPCNYTIKQPMKAIKQSKIHNTTSHKQCRNNNKNIMWHLIYAMRTIHLRSWNISCLFYEQPK